MSRQRRFNFRTVFTTDVVTHSILEYYSHRRHRPRPALVREFIRCCALADPLFSKEYLRFVEEEFLPALDAPDPVKDNLRTAAQAFLAVSSPQ
jgi:hypothetical protein